MADAIKFPSPTVFGTQMNGMMIWKRIRGMEKEFSSFTLVHKFNSLLKFAIIWWWKKIMIVWDCFNKKIVGWFYLNDMIQIYK